MFKVPGIVLSKMKPINPPMNIPEVEYTKRISTMVLDPFFTLLKYSCVGMYFGSACKSQTKFKPENYIYIKIK